MRLALCPLSLPSCTFFLCTRGNTGFRRRIRMSRQYRNNVCLGSRAYFQEFLLPHREYRMRTRRTLQKHREILATRFLRYTAPLRPNSERTSILACVGRDHGKGRDKTCDAFVSERLQFSYWALRYLDNLVNRFRWEIAVL